MDYISAKIIEDYQIWMKANGLCQNTISFHNRILRSVYNKAVEMDAIVDRQPFKKAYTGIDKTVKRALPIKLLKKMKNLDLSLNPRLDLARDLFLLSFYLRGMSFIDMAFLKKEDLKDKRVTYRRHKTGQLLTIEWTKEMEAILKKHPSKHPVYLLPIIPVDAENERRAYVYQLARVNRRLKEIGTMLGISIPLTTYNARHSWASAAKVRNVSISVISEGLGHDSETTTQIYLASLDTSSVDKANRKVISSLD